MQESVTLIKRKKSKKLAVTSGIMAVFFFFIIFFIFACLVDSKRKNLCFDTKTFYLVYAKKSASQSLSLAEQSRLKSLGGAGKFFEKNNENYLLASVYLKRDDANEIIKNLKYSFSGAGILEVSCPVVSQKKTKLIKQNQCYYELFKRLNLSLSEVENLNYAYLGGNLSEGKYMSNLISLKLEIFDFLKLCNEQKNDDLTEIVLLGNLYVSLIDSFFSKFYSSQSKESICQEFFVDYCLTYFDLCNNL